MQQSAQTSSSGNAEVLRGGGVELHIAPDGVALVPMSITDERRPDAAEWSEVESVEAEEGRGRLTLTFRGSRDPWTITGAARPEVLWAQDGIERELDRARAREHEAFRGRASLEKIAAALKQFGDDVSPQPTVIAELLCVQAARNRATDVHLQPVRGQMKARMRIDGQLMEAGEIPREVGARVIARLKVLAQMRSYTADGPQTGRLIMPVDERTIDVRLTTMPTIHGEKLTLRIFDPATQWIDLDGLGMDEETLTRYRRIIDSPTGCVITTGPAGAGKTTTTYASLAALRDAESARAISTVEEPVELDIPGVDQTEIDRARGLDFAAALRTVLRQDPQVLMVGEVRDPETARIAMQAALTGHMIFTTVHAPDAAGVFARLMDLGLEPYLVASSISAVVAQRLVRTVCDECAGDAAPDGGDLEAAGLTAADVAGWELRRGAGCGECADTGYRGRTGLFELLPMADVLREAILERRPVPEIERIAQSEGVGDLWEAGLAKVRAGETTLAELVRVLGRREER
ncbi:MAG: GspE/PulE family protein [Armatimonadota bacterium]